MGSKKINDPLTAKLKAEAYNNWIYYKRVLNDDIFKLQQADSILNQINAVEGKIATVSDKSKEVKSSLKDALKGDLKDTSSLDQLRCETQSSDLAQLKSLILKIKEDLRTQRNLTQNKCDMYYNQYVSY